MFVGYFIYLILLVLTLIPITRSDGGSLLSKKDTSDIRGISAIFVIVAHHQIWVDELLEVSTPKVVQLSIGQLGGIGVLLFFFVSGFGIHESYGKKSYIDRIFLVKRLIGVYIPYVIIKFILLPIKCCALYDNFNLVYELFSIFTIADWFIFVIVLQYFVYYIAFKISKKYILWISIGFDILFTVWFVIEDKPIGWFNALWLFTFGIAVSFYKDKIVNLFNNRDYIWGLIMCIGFCTCGLIFALNKGAVWANAVKPLSGTFLCLGFIIFFRHYRFMSKFTSWAGPRSMHLYVVHVTVWACTHMIDSPIFRLVVSLVCSILLTELTYKVTFFLTRKLKESFKI